VSPHKPEEANDAANRETDSEVAAIELFFDLVFVFAITQFTHLVEAAHGPGDILLILLLLGPLWWMYAAFSWLTSNAGESTTLRLIIIAAMAGFMIMAIATPDLFGKGGLVFGLSYLWVVVLHLAGFMWHGRHGASRAILAVAPTNLGSAVLLILAAFASGVWWLALLVAANLLFAVQIVYQIASRERRFALNAAHFAERYRLMIIIALGESIVAIALGSGAHFSELDGLVGLVLALALVSALWWSYFDREDESAEAQFAAAAEEERVRMSLVGYWLGHLVMIFGIVLIAAGIARLLGGEHEGIAGQWLLAGGVALFMAGDILFRVVLAVRPVVSRAICGALVLLLGYAGREWNAIAFLAVITLLLVVVVAAENRAKA
jgi:low temperature requirement protein LtrA